MGGGLRRWVGMGGAAHRNGRPVQVRDCQLALASGPGLVLGSGQKAFSFTSAAMQATERLVSRVAPTDSTVLITGESGTGKGVTARRLHEFSPRRDGPFVAVNCGAIPENLIESELFGYRGGSFTGARKEGMQGKLQQADGGTLFLDEIGPLSLVAQGKLPTAHKGMAHAAKVIAGTAIELILNPTLIAAAKADQRARLDGNPFVNPIPDDVMPPIPPASSGSGKA